MILFCGASLLLAYQVRVATNTSSSSRLSTVPNLPAYLPNQGPNLPNPLTPALACLPRLSSHIL